MLNNSTYQTIIRDITERKKIEENLRHKNELVTLDVNNITVTDGLCNFRHLITKGDIKKIFFY